MSLYKIRVQKIDSKWNEERRLKLLNEESTITQEANQIMKRMQFNY